MKKLALILAFAALLTGLSAAPAPAANDITGHVWVLDTTGAITTSEVRVRMIVWMDCTTGGHSFVLNDAAGALIFKDTDGEAGIPHVYYLDIPVTGITLQTLGSGYLLMDVQSKSY